MQTPWMAVQYLWAPLGLGYLFLWVFLWCLWPLWFFQFFLPFFFFFAGFPKLHLGWGSGYLHLFQSFAGWSLSYDNWANIWVKQNRIRSHFIYFFFILVWFYCGTLGNLASASGPSSQCEAWIPSHSMGLMLNQSFVVLQSLHHLCTSTSCRQNKLKVEGFVPVLVS